MSQNQPRIATQPRLMLDITNVIFEMADDITPKLDDNGAQKIDRMTGEPMWTVQLFGRGRAVGRKWSGQLTVTVISPEKPTAEDGDQVVPVNLEALPWTTELNGKTRTGIAYRATSLDVVSAPMAVQAA